MNIATGNIGSPLPRFGDQLRARHFIVVTALAIVVSAAIGFAIGASSADSPSVTPRVSEAIFGERYTLGAEFEAEMAGGNQPYPPVSSYTSSGTLVSALDSERVVYIVGSEAEARQLSTSFMTDEQSSGTDIRPQIMIFEGPDGEKALQSLWNELDEVGFNGVTLVDAR